MPHCKIGALAIATALAFGMLPCDIAQSETSATDKLLSVVGKIGDAFPKLEGDASPTRFSDEKAVIAISRITAYDATFVGEFTGYMDRCNNATKAGQSLAYQFRYLFGGASKLGIARDITDAEYSARSEKIRDHDNFVYEKPEIEIDAAHRLWCVAAFAKYPVYFRIPTAEN